MIKIENSFEPLSMEVVTEFELHTNKILPDTYKEFLLRQNGGEPIPDEFTVPGWAGESSAVSRFFAIHNGQSSNLEREIGVYKDRLSRTLIPIANDPGGNLICLGVDGEYFDKIYFWDHDDELDERRISR